MSTKNFCKNLGTELEAWKTSAEEIVKKFEAKPGHAKAGVLENIEDIRILVEDLQGRIHQLGETCSVDGFDDVVTERANDVKSQIDVRESDSAVSTIGGGNFGG
jgi:hypothetical protein